MRIDWLPFILQTSDPLFPTGAYAHSLGLEEWVRLSNEPDLRKFLELQILPALTHQELPYFRFVHEAGGVDEIAQLDREIHAWKIPAELREASIRLGSRRLEILVKTAPTPLLTEMQKRIAASDMHGHHITISAAQYSAVPLQAAMTAHAYQALSGYCVAALKLLRIGQEECQRALAACIPRIGEAIAKSTHITRDRAGWFNLLLEIASMRHETAFERMFIS